MNHLLRLCGCIVLVVLVSNDRTYAECLDSDVTVFFGNGVLTGRAEAWAAKDVLREFLDEGLATGSTTCNTRVLLAYNQTEGLTADLLDQARLERNIPGILFMSVVNFVVKASEAPDVADFVVDKIRSLINDDYLSAYESDLATHLEQYRAVLNSGGRVIVVAHSQGNLFANRAFETLLSEFGPSLANRMRIVSIATPDGKVAGESVVFPSLPNTTLHEDFIDNLPGALESNVWAVPEYSCGGVLDCHAFVTSYLSANDPIGRARILQKAQNAFAQDRIPKARFTMSAGLQSATEGQTLALFGLSGLSTSVSFDAARSTATDGSIALWEWRVGGSVFTSPAFSSQLATGTHAISLTVKNSAGLPSFAAGGTVTIGAPFPDPPPPNRPIARDDSYSMTQGTTLAVPAPGVLANDTYPPGSTIEFLAPFPPVGLTNVSPFNGGFILDTSFNPTFTGQLTLRYVIHSVNGDSNIAIVTVAVLPRQEQIFFDHFSNNSINSSFWDKVIVPGGGGTISATNGRLEMRNVMGGSQYLGLQSKCKLRGNFDVQVDFTLLNWPSENYHTVRMSVDSLPQGPFGVVGVYRNSYNTENYQLRTASGVVANVNRSDLSGKLRLTRLGSTVSGYYWNGASFVLLGASPTTVDDTRVVIDFAGASGAPINPPAGVAIAFDNFAAISATMVCVP